jgi:hypothetical protein
LRSIRFLLDGIVMKRIASNERIRDEREHDTDAHSGVGSTAGSETLRTSPAQLRFITIPSRLRDQRIQLAPLDGDVLRRLHSRSPADLT